MREAACDTSVLVPALVAWHPDHEAMRRALKQSVTAVPAHVLVECYSVLTRLPAPHRVAASDAAAAIAGVGLQPLGLPAAKHRDLVVRLAAAGVRGGAVYDGLVAATTRHHDRGLLTRDSRARATYDVLGARYTLV